MGKKKTLEDKKIIQKFGKNLNVIILRQKTSTKINKGKMAEIMDTSIEQVSKFLSGKNSIPVFRLYYILKELNPACADIAFLFDLKMPEEQPKTIPFLSFSDYPELEKKIQIIKQIYDDGDEGLIEGINICLSGYVDKFLKKTEERKGNKKAPKKPGLEGNN